VTSANTVSTGSRSDHRRPAARNFAARARNSDNPLPSPWATPADAARLLLLHGDERLTELKVLGTTERGDDATQFRPERLGRRKRSRFLVRRGP
jgi:hypothetical protein